MAFTEKFLLKEMYLGKRNALRLNDYRCPKCVTLINRHFAWWDMISGFLDNIPPMLSRGQQPKQLLF